MNVNDKIKQILIDKSLSPSVFADEIGVQRSSISHILSGRNRPSFDIIQKVIRRFPDLGYDWIMEDDSHEEPVSFGNVSTRRAVPASQVNPVYGRDTRLTNSLPQDSQLQPKLNMTRVEPAKQIPISETPLSTPLRIPAEKTVERILIFYTDGTFREYTPAL